MFKKEGVQGAAGDTVIAMGVKVEGDFVSDGNVVIEGEVVGSLKAAMDLHVGDAARITADVSAANARIAGDVRGNVWIREKLELTSSSKVTGDIHAKVLTVESGAQVNGRVLMSADDREAEVHETQAAGLSALVGGGRGKAEKAERPA